MAWIVVLAALLPIHCQAERTEHVLLIFSYHPTFPTTEKVLAGIESVLGRRQSVMMDVEYMDAKRHSGVRSRQHFLTGLKYRLASRPDYDLVMVVDDAALYLAEQHQEVLFRQAPLVFLGINDYEHARRLAEQGMATGVVEQTSMLGTLQLMQTLTPERHRVWLVSDGTLTGQHLSEHMMMALKRVPDMESNWLSLANLGWDEFYSRLSGLGEEDAVLLLSAFQDVHGKTKIFNESLNMILSQSQVPIYHLWEHGIGQGLLGGRVVSHFEQGRIAAEQARQLLDGRLVEQVPPLLESPNLVQVDMREIRHFGISEDHIPVGAVRLYEVQSLLDRHRSSVVVALSLLPVFLGLMFFLWRQSQARKRLARQLERKETQLRLLVRTIPDLVWFKDVQGRYITCNRAMEQFIGLPESDIAGRCVDDFFDAETARSINAIDRTVMVSQQDDLCEQHLKPTTGAGEMDIEAIRVPMFGDKGALLGVLGIGRDITRRVAAELNLKEREALLSSVISEMPDIFVLKDSLGKFVLCNDNVARLYNTTPDQMVGKDDADFGVPQKLADQMADNVRQIMASEQAEVVYEDSVDAATGQLRHFKSIKKPVVDVHGRRQIIVIAQDITDLVVTQKQLRESEQKLHGILDNVDAYIYLKDQDGNYQFVNRLVRELWQLTDDDILGKDDQAFFDENSARLIQEVDRRVLEQGETVRTDEVITPQSTGESMSFQVTKLPLRNERDEIYALCGVSVDVTERVEYQRKLERLAHYDPLTGVLNRSHFAQVLQDKMQQAQEGGESLMVLYIDLDGFKQINDTYGHDVGDRFLRCIAVRLQETLDEQGQLARYGGDEFIAVLTCTKGGNSTSAVLQHLLDELSESVSVDDLMLRVTASIGVAHYPQTEDQDADQLVRQADQAMYTAKVNGKNRFHYFDAELNLRAVDRRNNLQRLAQALQNQELMLYFQPKVNMRDGLVVGAEALIRWQHPERGVLPPAAFLPDTEHSVLGIHVGDWVIEQALATLALWQSEGRFVPISVNISNLQLSQVDFVGKLARQLALYPDFVPGSLELEILETSALDDLSEVTDVMHQCENLGVYFSIDDFGTGYSSLTYLKRLPARQLKIDRSFVFDILTDPDDLAIVNGVVGMAKAFGMEIIAEGVETVEHGRVLMELGCELGQGYGISRPVPAAEFCIWMDAWQLPECWKTSE